MTAEAVHAYRISPEEYLAGELASPDKHEFLNGVVYAMAGANIRHNTIVGNTFAALYIRLRGKACRPYNSDTKVRISLPDDLRFYYPDVQVTCEPNPEDEAFHDRPVLVIEVISESTRRVDEGEKKDAYLALRSLQLYLLVEPSRATVVGYRRGPTNFRREVHSGLDALIGLDFLGAELPLSEIYERVSFSGRESS